MIITLKDGSTKEYAEAMSAYDIARDISEGLARAACLAEIDGETADLRTIIDKDCELNILTFDSDEGKAILRDLGIEGDYEGVGNCILGYADCEQPQARPRKENWVYWAE